MHCGKCGEKVHKEWAFCPACSEPIPRKEPSPSSLNYWQVSTEGEGAKKSRDLGIHFGHFLDVARMLSGEVEAALTMRVHEGFKPARNEVVVRIEGDYVEEGHALVDVLLGERNSEVNLRVVATGVKIIFLGRDRGLIEQPQEGAALRRRILERQRPFTPEEKAARVAAQIEAAGNKKKKNEEAA